MFKLKFGLRKSSKLIKMKKATQDFVIALPGPVSTYCNCNKACSNIVLDYVVPKRFLYSRISLKNELDYALNDPHNIYRCCLRSQERKGNSILTDKYAGDENTGLMSRSYLYMNERYRLKFNSLSVSKWKELSMMHSPHRFERQRSLKIAAYTGFSNAYIDLYPSTIHSKY
jgi:hypothetical protein